MDDVQIDRALVVYPVLHSSGFGNQIGMLLQHVALAVRSSRTLVLPPIHQPSEHRMSALEEASLPAEEALNLSALAPLLRVLSLKEFITATERVGRRVTISAASAATLSFSALPIHGRSHGRDEVWPLAMATEPTSALASATELLRRPNSCARPGTGYSCAIAYCHLVSCRSRTKRACRRWRSRCTRTAQRLPNNYLFAHRLPPLLCDTISPYPFADQMKNHSAGLAIIRAADDVSTSSSSSSEEQAMLSVQRRALAALQVGSGVKLRASSLARQLGNFSAIHVRLSDAGDAQSKGLQASELPTIIQRAVRHLGLPSCGSSGSRSHRLPHASSSTPLKADSFIKSSPWLNPTTIYIASNRPATVQALLVKIASAVANERAAEGCDPRSVSVRSWSSVARGVDEHRSTSVRENADSQSAPNAPGENASYSKGLRAALVEHELCVLAPLGFAGSTPTPTAHRPDWRQAQRAH